MEKIVFDHTQEVLQDGLGITNERVEQLFKLFKKDEWELSCPDKEDGCSGGELLERFISHAETPAELVFCSYIAGAHIENLNAQEEEFDCEGE